MDSATSHDTIVDKTSMSQKDVNACPECGQRFSAEATFCPFDGSKLVVTHYEPGVDPLLGTTIDGRYEVIGLVGEGGMGTVYEVRHTMLGRAFAMKVLRRDMAREGDLAARFINEAKATGSIKHPHIVSITDFGRLVDTTPFFVMEMLVGRTLAQVLKESGALEMTRAHSILSQMSGALAQAHEAGVIHRDLKPENVFLARPAGGSLVGAPDDVKVVDFGAAKVLGSSRITKTGIVFGTPHYMSPEQASGQPVDHRADIYALGVIMYEMLTGRVPFEAETYMGVLTQHMFVRPKPPSTVRPDRADQLGALEDIALRALEKRPEDRYQTMHGLAADLEKAARGEDIARSLRPSSLRPPPASDTDGKTSRPFVQSSTSIPGLAAPRSVRSAALLGALFGLLVVGALILVRWRPATVAQKPPSSVASPLPPSSGLPRPPLSAAPATASSAATPPSASVSSAAVAAQSATSVASSGGSPSSVPRRNTVTGGSPPSAGNPQPRNPPASDRPTSRRAQELPDPWAK
jgi:eukaryotic-like serine/threonine-protein kinase